ARKRAEVVIERPVLLHDHDDVLDLVYPDERSRRPGRAATTRGQHRRNDESSAEAQATRGETAHSEYAPHRDRSIRGLAEPRHAHRSRSELAEAFGIGHHALFAQLPCCKWQVVVTRVLSAEVVLDVGASHGEGPLWHGVDRRLDWGDVCEGLLHRFDPVNRRAE